MSDDKLAESIRIWFGQAESGWATTVGAGLVRINNIPLESGLNIDDVVRLRKTRGKRSYLPSAGKVVESVFPCKTAITYSAPHKQTFAKIRKVLTEAGCKVKGALPGVALVAHKKNVKPIKLVKAAGVECGTINSGHTVH